MREMAYGAFISYRHAEPDRGWAKWLHSALETYRTPKLLVAAGAPARVGRVFRDEEELAASPHLSAVIDSALQRSGFLIVICSPRTPESGWIEQEVVRFQRLGRGDRILALLVEGEPGDAFPAPLRELEPLAGDVRPRPGESPRQLRQNAKLRLLAAVLGCNYDDLRRREDERRRRKLAIWATVSSLLLVLMSALAVVAMTQRSRAEREAARAIEAAREAQAQTLAARAQLALASTPLTEELGTAGPERAILLAIESLRLKPTIQGDETLRNGLAKLPPSPNPAWVPKHADEEPIAPDSLPPELTSPDGRYRVRLSEESNDVTLEDADGGRRWSLGHEWPLQAMRFSPDSRWLCTVTGMVSMDASDPGATALPGSTVRVWETGNGIERTRVSLAQEGGIERVVFGPDGDVMATFGRQGLVRLWTLWPAQLQAEACSRISRNLSPTEWQTFIGTEPYRETCTGLPVVSE